jgi:predicted O-methyltransferase YrrM
LEVGTAEGNSLYVLSHALKQPRAAIGIIDYGEEHTKKARQEILEWIRSDLRPRWIREKYGNSHDPSLFIDIAECEEGVLGYDVVLIDAGHAYEDVIADAIAYGSLATKYIFFHDVCLPEVGRAFDWYCKQRPDCRAYKMINSETFGYGIMEITQ